LFIEIRGREGKKGGAGLYHPISAEAIAEPGNLLNGQPFAAIFNLVLIVFCVIFGLVFHVLLLVPSAHALDRGSHETRGAPAPGGGRGDPPAWPPRGYPR
jgi:hypothetical protein